MKKNFNQPNLNQDHFQSRQKIEYEDEATKSNTFKLSSILINISNALSVGLGLTLFIIGILYLTVYRYRYSFTTFSIDLMAGIFIAVGSLMCLLGFSGVFLIKPFGRPVISALYSVVIFAFFCSCSFLELLV